MPGRLLEDRVRGLTQHQEVAPGGAAEAGEPTATHPPPYSRTALLLWAAVVLLAWATAAVAVWWP